MLRFQVFQANRLVATFDNKSEALSFAGRRADHAEKVQRTVMWEAVALFDREVGTLVFWTEPKE